jgi:hypothetical protein
MSPSHWSEWQPSPRLRQLLAYFHMPYTTVQYLPEIGSSAGDAVWTGDYLILEAGMFMPWVSHEVGHMVCAMNRDPLARREPNYGNDRAEEHRYWDDNKEETRASHMGLWFHVACGLPWVRAARKLNSWHSITEEEMEEFGEHGALRRSLDKAAKKYLPSVVAQLEDTPPDWLAAEFDRLEILYRTCPEFTGGREDRRRKQ